jgi:hypothetical protein
VLEEVTLLKAELVLVAKDEELECCIVKLCVEDEFVVVLLVDNNVVVEVEELVEELEEDDVCEVLPVLDVLEVGVEELKALNVLFEEAEDEVRGKEEKEEEV